MTSPVRGESFGVAALLSGVAALLSGVDPKNLALPVLVYLVIGDGITILTG